MKITSVNFIPFSSLKDNPSDCVLGFDTDLVRTFYCQCAQGFVMRKTKALLMICSRYVAKELDACFPITGLIIQCTISFSSHTFRCLFLQCAF
jgi:hypothetical protein